jgi:hypothetical protein
VLRGWNFFWDDFLGVIYSLFRAMGIDIIYGYVELVQGFTMVSAILRLKPSIGYDPILFFVVVYCLLGLHIN